MIYIAIESLLRFWFLLETLSVQPASSRGRSDLFKSDSQELLTTERFFSSAKVSELSECNAEVTSGWCCGKVW